MTRSRERRRGASSRRRIVAGGWLPLALAAGALAGGSPLRAQPDRAAASAHVALRGASDRPDSGRTLQVARRAQRAFELRRRQHLPWARWPLGGGACDERIGRFCLWYDDHDDRWRPPPEPAAVRAERGRLVRQLDAAAALLPGDAWIAGQRVRYLAEADRTPEAIAAAAACRAERWWCLALAGLAHHAAGDAPAADAAFDSALAIMPDEQRRAWTDLTVLLDDASRSAYRRLRDSAGARALDSLERRFWWLADPLWMRPGNDRRAEHFSRHVMNRLQRRALSPEGIAPGADLEEILIRYGWPAGWERERPSPGSPGSAGVRIHHAPDGRRFEPPWAAAVRPSAAPADGWPLRFARARAEYAPRALEAVDDALPHQLARFRRGDSMLVVVAYDLERAGVRGSEGAEVVLIAATEATAPVRTSRAAGATRGTLGVLAPAAHGVVSLEAVIATDAGMPRARRARYGIAPLPASDTLALSDILLIGPADPPAESLAEAVERARATATLVAGERVGLYWEVYGSAGEDSLLVSLSLRSAGRDWLGRAAERIGLRRRAQGALLRWWETAGEESLLARTLVLQLPVLPEGRYAIELVVSGRGGRAEARRSVDVRGESAP